MAHTAQVFNEFNARKIQDELNVFEGLWQSRTFLYIEVITVAFQVRLTRLNSCRCRVGCCHAHLVGASMCIQAHQPRTRHYCCVRDSTCKRRVWQGVRVCCSAMARTLARR